MAQRSGRVREWIGRYLVAELAGLTTALLAALAVTSWDPDRLAIAAYASALGEGVGFYAGFLIVRYLREEIDGPPRRRIAVIVTAAVVEFGPAEIIDTALIRPAAMFLGSLATGNVIIGVLIGKVAADIVFYGLAITSYEVLVRRFLHRFRRTVSVDDSAATEAATPRVAATDSTTEVPPTGPELIMDLEVVTDRFRSFREALPQVAVHFAMKCQPDRPLLRHLLRPRLPLRGRLLAGAGHPDRAGGRSVGSDLQQPGQALVAHPGRVRRGRPPVRRRQRRRADQARPVCPGVGGDDPTRRAAGGQRRAERGQVRGRTGRGGPAAAGRGRRRAAPVGTHLPRRFPDDGSAGLDGTDPRGADDHGTTGARRRPARGAGHRRRFPGRLRAAGAADRGLRRCHRLCAGHPAVRGRGAGRARGGLWSPTPVTWRPR